MKKTVGVFSLLIMLLSNVLTPLAYAVDSEGVSDVSSESNNTASEAPTQNSEGGGLLI